MRLTVTVGDESYTFRSHGPVATVTIASGETPLPALEEFYPDGPFTTFTVADLVGRTGPCFRCGEEVASQVEVAYLDGAGRNDCAESEDGLPHEIDPPEGWTE